MAELTSKDRLQPALLDRLTDEEPWAAHEPRDRRVISMRQLRHGVLRDLGALLNASRPLERLDLTKYPYVARSVLNYGFPALTGRVQSGLDPSEIAGSIADAILAFEPRILPHTLSVTPVPPEDTGHANTLAFLIEGDLWAQPYPERLYVRTELDLEDGEVMLRANDGGRHDA
ncbi:type VI secretion system baseplate subunit TssE [Bordetella genomosp. 9]|uniref:Type VI secretion system lysozyme n=1 Tax=Bordetella genomosp. 9 TaxID=1416803 RepID=A0A1W6YWU5_9BORD|nr:type VI secretion system baseplate subunit TssE [Bordetella genomosp. 9]ARP85565.1 type VI secretion system lysozyme [Bordetella genomosp. 9]ARP89539.1 type VI secretion system lysozyme [Bordetella genomosp. 9]